MDVKDKQGKSYTHVLEMVSGPLKYERFMYFNDAAHIIDYFSCDTLQAGALSTIATHVGNRHDGELTFVGRVLAALPIDIKIGKLILLGHVFGLLEECLIIGKTLSGLSSFTFSC